MSCHGNQTSASGSPNRLFRPAAASEGHAGSSSTLQARPRLALVGSPNVGKSVIFNTLTGAYVTVSNYPGTTVEVSRGVVAFGGTEVEVIDTPGMYSLLPMTEEERVARTLLLDEHPDLVVHVVDAKNLDRMLPLTLQLIEAGFRVLLVANMMDEARRMGVSIDLRELSRRLGVPVVGTAAVRGQGMTNLQARIGYMLSGSSSSPGLPDARVSGLSVKYPEGVECTIAVIEPLLEARYGLTGRSLALLLAQGDQELMNRMRRQDLSTTRQIAGLSERLGETLNADVSLSVSLARRQVASDIVSDVVGGTRKRPVTTSELLGRLAMHPVWGLPILALVMYFGLYKFVGVFGAGTVVDFLEVRVFQAFINPVVNGLLLRYIPWQPVRELFGFDYGLITLGVRYAAAIVLPIVGTFFLVFSVIEDSGYLPRLAMLVDRWFRVVGLSGRAVIPMTLGFGCDTMATMVTRTLETTRERMIATFLLALAIPCSAQLGVIMALLSTNLMAMIVWIAFMLGVFLLIGYLTAQVMPGEGPSFYMELPPLRFPSLTNVISKTYTRMYWYFVEVLPLFLVASVIIWVGRQTGFFDAALSAITPLVQWIGLPPQAAEAFLFGFFRRDYGAAGLYDLVRSGTLAPQQLVVAAATLTLFIPCIAQFIMMWKERGWKTAIAMTAFIFPFAFVAGWVLNSLLNIIPLPF